MEGENGSSSDDDYEDDLDAEIEDTSEFSKENARFVIRMYMFVTPCTTRSQFNYHGARVLLFIKKNRNH
jgi:hypothetical protein